MKLEDVKRRVLSNLNEKAAIELTRELVRIRSYSGEEEQVALFLGERLEQMGFEVNLLEVEKNRPNVLAKIKGAGEGPSLMFNGHLDTNPKVEGWTKDPFGAEIEDGWLYGVGVHNMKAAAGAAIMAFEAIKKSKIKLNGDLIYAGVVGELQGGIGTKNLTARGITSDYAIIGEPTSLNIMTAHAGVIQLRLTTIGKTVHMAIINQGVNAIEKMYKVIEMLKTLKISSSTPHFELLPRINIGAIKGGISREYHDWRASIVPDFCTITIDIRIAPRQRPEDIIETIKEQLVKLTLQDSTFKTEIEVLKPPTNVYMPPFEIMPDAPIIKTISSAHKYVTGRSPKIGAFEPYIFLGTDASHLTEAGVQVAVYGPGKLEHIGKYVDEKVALTEISTAAKVYALTALDICFKLER